MLREAAGVVARCRLMVHQTAESLLEIGILAGRGVQAGLCRFGRNMRRNIVAQMEDALTAVVCLLLVFDAVRGTE